MATVTGAITVYMCTNMVEGIRGLATLTLQAWGTIGVDPTVVLLDTQTPATMFGVVSTSGISATIDLDSDVTFTLAATETVEEVRLYFGSLILAAATLITDNDFPNGGDLIVTSFEVTAED